MAGLECALLRIAFSFGVLCIKSFLLLELHAQAQLEASCDRFLTLIQKLIRNLFAEREVRFAKFLDYFKMLLLFQDLQAVQTKFV